MAITAGANTKDEVRKTTTTIGLACAGSTARGSALASVTSRQPGRVAPRGSESLHATPLSGADACAEHYALKSALDNILRRYDHVFAGHRPAKNVLGRNALVPTFSHATELARYSDAASQRTWAEQLHTQFVAVLGKVSRR